MNTDTKRKKAATLYLVCPLCEDLDGLRDLCLYCDGMGYVPGPALYEGDMQARPGMFRTTGEALKALAGYAIFGILVGIPAAFLLLRALGIIQ